MRARVLGRTTLAPPLKEEGVHPKSMSSKPRRTSRQITVVPSPRVRSLHHSRTTIPIRTIPWISGEITHLKGHEPTRSGVVQCMSPPLLLPLFCSGTLTWPFFALFLVSNPSLELLACRVVCSKGRGRRSPVSVRRLVLSFPPCTHMQN